MTVKKPVPCSSLDVRGIQEWLDEMALQGLFLSELGRRFEKAVFEVGDPKPVRYRLDPVAKNDRELQAREDLYTQMGWRYVDHLYNYRIYSCDDPQAPELYSDPQSLALAMKPLVRREIRIYLLCALFALFTLILPVLTSPRDTVQNLLLWRNPRDLVFSLLYPVLLVLCLPFMFFELKQVLNTRSTLSQGLSLKAKKRRRRVPFYAWYIPFWICTYWIPRLFLPSIGWEVCRLEDYRPSHPWPTLAQIEAADPSLLEEVPDVDGYVEYNDSPLAPVQEFIDRYQVVDPAHPSSSADLSSIVRYVRASSPRIARWIYQLELDEETKNLEKRQGPSYTYPVTDLTPFTPRDWPGLDRLEVAAFRWTGKEHWIFAALRGNDVLLVTCAGSARWEDCLPLFLEALDKEVTS